MEHRHSSLGLAKRFSLIACLCVLTALVAVGAGLPGDLSAASVSLAWNANTESNITGYNVYYGTVSKATDPTVYRTLRVGTFSYTIPLANGNYNVTLESAETYFHAKGQRVFTVSMNGTKMISALDVYARVGFDAALNITVPVSVTNGSLVIQFTPTVNAAIVNAIVLKQ